MHGAIAPANLLVTLDSNYLPQLRVMLLSLRVNNPRLECRVFLLNRSIRTRTSPRWRPTSRASAWSCAPSASIPRRFRARRS